MIVWDVLGYIVLAYVALWVLTLLGIAALGTVLVASRGPSGASRRVFRQVVSMSGKDAVRTGGEVDSAAVEESLDRLRSRDAAFDAGAFLDVARVAAGAYAVASSVEDDRLLRHVTTAGFWQTRNGQAISAALEDWKRYAGDRPGTSNRGRVLFDVSWRQPEIVGVALGVDGIDRITVRLCSVVALATTEVTYYDWEFVRPTAEGTDPSAVLIPRQCLRCGAPYRADFDDSCPNCHQPRPDSRAGWRLDHNYFVVGHR